MQDLGSLKHKVLGVLQPSDAQKLKQLERDMALFPSYNAHKEQFKDYLLRSCCQGMMQVKDYHSEQRELEVRAISSENLDQAYLLVSQFKLIRIV
mmetsp:Transcript_45536/g.33295  ORF Transcript_45536/g.33295 Transcript_45536/m.33295 type:complete len:95 (-) Transcript_45536:13-297(-)